MARSGLWLVLRAVQDRLTSSRLRLKVGSFEILKTGGEGVSAFVAKSPQGVNLSGGMLTLRYRSSGVVEPLSIELKPVQPSTVSGCGPS